MSGQDGKASDVGTSQMWERRLNRTEELTTSGYWSFDLNRGSLIWSDNYYRLLGYKPGEIDPSLEILRSHIHPEDRERVLAILETTRTTKQHIATEYRFLTKNGEIRWGLIHLFWALGETGGVLGYDGFLQDITRRKETEKTLKEVEQELMQAKKKAEESDRLKAAFLANMNHELRTPMNGIMGFAGLLDEPGITPSKRRSYVKIVNESCRKLLSLVNNILDISLLETGLIHIMEEQVCLNDIFLDIYSSFKSGINQANVSFYISTPLPDDQAVICTDPSRLRQILDSLVDNAVKYTHQGHIVLGYEVEGRDVIFFVEDTGIGIPEHLHCTIFERFRQAETEYTRQYSGAGLGLTITKKIVELLGGKIWLRSAPDRGATFYFSLPAKLTIQQADMEEQATGVEKEDFSAFTVLVAEDDAINYLYIENLLRLRRIPVIHAKNGLEAVNAVKQHPHIGLIFMDIKMPGMNGYEAAESIRKTHPEIPIIALTALALPEEKHRSQENGFAGYIPKPFDQSTLETALEKYLPSPHRNTGSSPRQN